MNTPSNKGHTKSESFQRQQPPPPSPHNPSTPQNHDFVMMAIMEMKKELGGISSDLRTLSKIESRLDKIEESVSAISKQMYAAWVVIVIALAIGGFFIDKLWDTAAEHITISTKN